MVCRPEAYLKVVADRHHARITQDVERCPAQHRCVIRGYTVHKPDIDRKPEDRQQPNEFRIVLLHFVLEILFPDDVDGAVSGGGSCSVRYRTESIIHPLLKNAAEKSSGRDRDDRDAPVHPAGCPDIIPDRFCNTGRKDKNTGRVEGGSTAKRPFQRRLAPEDDLVLQQAA